MIDEDADRERAVEVLGADESSRHADALESEIRLGEGASRREDEQATREKQRALHTTPSLVSGASADRSATTRTGTPNEGLSAGDAERFTPYASRAPWDRLGWVEDRACVGPRGRRTPANDRPLVAEMWADHLDRRSLNSGSA